MKLLFVLALGLSLLLGFSTEQLAAEDLAEDKQKKHYIGYGRLITNDVFGDGKDRWRTGSFSSSRIWGPKWLGQLPHEFTEVIEVRFLGEIIAPSDLSGKGGIDRPFVGHLGFGLHSHFQRKGLEYSVGVGASVLGKQTGLDKFQSDFHKALNEKVASELVLSSQIGDQVLFGPLAEVAKTVPGGDEVHIRPFFEAYSTAETLARLGADIYFGNGFSNSLYIRDQVTGQRYRTIGASEEKFGFSIGGDIGHVSKSAFFDGAESTMLHRRLRFRTGLHWGQNSKQGFAGLTWLSKEFSGQPEGQILGSVRLILKF